MPERLLRYRTTSFIGFVGIFICAMIGLARLPGLGAAESVAHGLAWIGVILAAVIMGRAWWNLAPEIFGGRMPLLGFVLLVFFVTWVWVWFAIVLVKCEGNLRTCGQWRLALDLGGLVAHARLGHLAAAHRGRHRHPPAHLHPHPAPGLARPRHHHPVLGAHPRVD